MAYALSAAREAASIFAVSASCPVQSLNDSAAWYTSMPSPPTAFAPRDFAAARNGVSAGLYTRSKNSVRGCRSSAATGDCAAVSEPAVPMGVQFTIRSASLHIVRYDPSPQYAQVIVVPVGVSGFISTAILS